MTVTTMPSLALDVERYAKLVRRRALVRDVLAATHQAARSHQVTPAQHELLLVVAATAAPGPSIRQVAEALCIAHHSAVELVDRAEGAGLVRRHRDANDARRCRIRLTTRGSEVMRALGGAHEDELRRLPAALAME